MTSTVRPFDLNIEQFLDAWGVAQAVRELVANALDEQALTATAEVQITSSAAGTWHIRDWGRGLRYEHLTQNESAEKQARADQVMGRFGVGLKDALATLHRHGVEVQVYSPHLELTLAMQPKAGFADLQTLHAMVAAPSRPDLVGTEVVLRGVTDEQMAEAKRYFLHFSGETVLGMSEVGQVLSRPAAGPARIYIGGLRVAEEEDFLFSYNITSLTAAIRKGLNRERTNVKREVYSDRIKRILLTCDAPEVARRLAQDMTVQAATGEAHDEVRWLDVAVRACKLLQDTQRVVFMTVSERDAARDMVDDAEAAGYQVLTVTDKVRQGLQGMRDQAGEPLRTLQVYREIRAASFQFEFVPPEALTPPERALWEQRQAIAACVGGLPRRVRAIRLSETMRPDPRGDNTLGLWDAGTGEIIIKRSELRSLVAFASTLLHEIAHACSGHPDVSRAFESELTQLLGLLAARLLEG